jgi:hypothetical protein
LYDKVVAERRRRTRQVAAAARVGESLHGFEQRFACRARKEAAQSDCRLAQLGLARKRAAGVVEPAGGTVHGFFKKP